MIFTAAKRMLFYDQIHQTLLQFFIYKKSYIFKSVHVKKDAAVCIILLVNIYTLT